MPIVITPPPASTPPPSGLTGADNGLSVSANIAQLGGPLIKDTEITLSGNNLVIAGPNFEADTNYSGPDNQPLINQYIQRRGVATIGRAVIFPFFDNFTNQNWIAYVVPENGGFPNIQVCRVTIGAYVLNFFPTTNIQVQVQYTDNGSTNNLIDVLNITAANIGNGSIVTNPFTIMPQPGTDVIVTVTCNIQGAAIYCNSVVEVVAYQTA